VSRELLNALAGATAGAFRQWLDEFEGEPRVAWYPSVGRDFRDLLYLSRKISELYPPSKPEPLPPDVFCSHRLFSVV